MRFLASFASMCAAIMGGIWIGDHFGLVQWQGAFLAGIIAAALSMYVERPIITFLDRFRSTDSSSKE